MRSLLPVALALCLLGCESGDGAPPPSKLKSTPVTPPPPPAPKPEPGFHLNETNEIPMTFMVVQEGAKPGDGGRWVPGGDWTVLDVTMTHRDKSADFGVAMRVDAEAMSKKQWRAKGVGEGDIAVFRTKKLDENAEWLMRRFAGVLGAGLPPPPPQKDRAGRVDFKLTVIGTRMERHANGYRMPGTGEWVLARAGVDEEGERLDFLYVAFHMKDRQMRWAAWANSGEALIPLGNSELGTKLLQKAWY